MGAMEGKRDGECVGTMEGKPDGEESGQIPRSVAEQLVALVEHVVAPQQKTALSPGAQAEHWPGGELKSEGMGRGEPDARLHREHLRVDPVPLCAKASGHRLNAFKVAGRMFETYTSAPLVPAVLPVTAHPTSSTVPPYK